MDDKQRIPLPRQYRDQFETPGYLTRSRTDPCIALFTQDGFAEAAEEIEAEASRNTPEGAEKRRQFYGFAGLARKDTQGRVTIPGKLIEFAGLGKDIMIVGAGKSMEIWDRARWDAHQAALLVPAGSQGGD